MMTERKGGCLCGAVRYELTVEPAMMAVCHCTHCQRQSGSAFSCSLVVKPADYTQQGETKVFQDKGDSGKGVYRHFCGHCGSAILSTIDIMPDTLMIKMGTLDDFSGISPVIEVYADHAVSWISPIAMTRRFGQAAG